MTTTDSPPSRQDKVSRHGKKTHKQQQQLQQHQQHSPSDPILVRTPQGNDSRLLPRPAHQRTPRKLCTLAMPPPLPPPWLEESDGAGVPSRHRRNPSDHTAALSVDPTEYSHVTSATNPHRVGGGAGMLEGVPLHCRIGMAACDPLLLACRFVVVAAVDGRVALYRLEDYELEEDEDVSASEQRRRAEWKEEDTELDDDEEKKQSMEDSFEDVLQEEAVMERMVRRERCRECVDPLLVVSLPAHGNARYKEEESPVGHLPTGVMTPMIVDMCVTPPGLGLIQHRGREITKDDMKMPGCQRLIGHVAILMDNGDVHVLEFLSDDDTTSVIDSAIPSGDAFRNSVPMVNVILSFRTGYLSATCICMQPIFETPSSPNTKRDCNADTRSGAAARCPRDGNKCHIRNIRLCIGHECGILECYQVYCSICTFSDTAVGTDRCSNSYSNGNGISSPYSLVKSRSNETPRNNNNNNNNNNTMPKRNSSFLSARVSLDAKEDNVKDSFDLTCVNNSPILFRTLSEPTDSLSASAHKPPSSEFDNGTRHSIKVEMRWRGKMAVPIRSIACPVWSSSSAGGEPPSLLVIGLMQRQQENGLYASELHRTGSKSNYRELSPAISLEVIDAALAQKSWRHRKSEEACKHDARDLCVTLNDCSVWPAAGMEIKDGWTRSDDHTRDTLCRALGLRSVSITNKLCHFVDDHPCFASAASDGTVAISHLNPDGSWGVHHELNQIMLHQRCIGMGAIEYTSSSNDRSRYICCCLRGGTMYLVPVIDRGENALSRVSTFPMRRISMFAVPVDPSGEDDGAVRYVQNFAAGMAYLPLWQDGPRDIDRRTSSGIPKDASLKSVALVGWNGGIIDVYELHPGENGHNEELFQQLVERGLARKLVEKLLVVNQSHPLISSALWCEAWYECNKVRDLDVILKGITNVSKMDFVSTRELILSVIES